MVWCTHGYFMSYTQIMLKDVHIDNGKTTYMWISIIMCQGALVKTLVSRQTKMSNKRSTSFDKRFKRSTPGFCISKIHRTCVHQIPSYMCRAYFVC